MCATGDRFKNSCVWVFDKDSSHGRTTPLALFMFIASFRIRFIALFKFIFADFSGRPPKSPPPSHLLHGEGKSDGQCQSLGYDELACGLGP